MNTVAPQPWTVVRRSEKPRAFSSLLENASFETSEQQRYLGSLEDYFDGVFEGRIEDITFVIAAQDKPLLLVSGNVADDILGNFRSPLELSLSDTLAPELKVRLAKLVFEELKSDASRHRAKTILVGDGDTAKGLSEIGAQCLAMRGVPQLRLHAVADVHIGEEELWRDLRKSYRSLINWGRRNLRMEWVNQDNPRRDQYDDYQAFHRRIAGRATRPQASWDAMYDRLAAGGAELLLGFLDDALVAASLLTYESETAHYSAGVYDREKFDKPLGHWPVYLAMLRSQERGLKYFNLGIVPAHGTVSEKEFGVGFFKKGFTSRIEARLNWEIPVAPGAED